MKDFGNGSFYSSFDFSCSPCLSISVFPLLSLCFSFSSIEALKEDLDGSVVISVAQWITSCNVTKPFSLLLTSPSLAPYNIHRPALSFSHTHTALPSISSSIYKELDGIVSNYKWCLWQGQTQAQILSKGSIDWCLLKARDISRC